MSLPTPPPETSRSTPNTVLWAVFALTAVGAGAFFVLHVHRSLGVDTWLGLVALLSRTALYVSIGLFVEALLLRTAGGYMTATRPRRMLIHANAMALIVLCVSLVVDVFVFAFAGYHLTTAIRILFSDGPAGAGKVVEATGLPASAVIGIVVGLCVAVAAAVGVLRVTRRLSSRLSARFSSGLSSGPSPAFSTGRPFEVTRRAALVGMAVAVAAIAVVDSIGYRVRNPFLWEREIQSVPLAFALVRPAAELASFRVAVKRLDQGPSWGRAKQLVPLDERDRPDMFIVVVESLRKDIVTPDVMPRFASFSRDSWTFEHAQTTGNVTHYSWYGLMCGEYPLFFDGVKNSTEAHGSIPLFALRKLGYRVRLFATPDLGYQNLQHLVFGADGSILESQFHPAEPLPAERDRLVVRELSRTLATEKPGGTVYVMALDSTHYDYSWGTGFRPPFTPYASDASITKSYEADAKARQALFNRYKSSVAWMDGLLGEFFDALESTGRMKNSIVVITGDHGEAFWEHGSGTHGSDLGTEQVDVGFALRLPGQPATHFDAVFSLMDVMPTLLTQVGVDTTGMVPGVPVQSRRSSQDERLAPRSALTFQGWNSQAFRFALTRDDRRMILELDQANPLEARHMVLKDITDLNSASLVHGTRGDVPGVYDGVIRDLPRLLDSLPFLEL